MGSDPVRVGSVVIDFADLELMTRFWGDALGYRPDESGRTERWCRLGDPAGRVNVSLQVVPDPTPGKNRLHLDLYPTGRDKALPMQRRIEVVETKVAELVTLGADVERRTRHDDPQDPVYFVVMHDPEGNEFCVG